MYDCFTGKDFRIPPHLGLWNKFQHGNIKVNTPVLEILKFFLCVWINSLMTVTLYDVEFCLPFNDHYVVRHSLHLPDYNWLLYLLLHFKMINMDL